MTITHFLNIQKKTVLQFRALIRGPLYIFDRSVGRLLSYRKGKRASNFSSPFCWREPQDWHRTAKWFCLHHYHGQHLAVLPIFSYLTVFSTCNLLRYFDFQSGKCCVSVQWTLIQHCSCLYNKVAVIGQFVPQQGSGHW